MVKDSLDLWRDSLFTALTSMLQKIAVGSEDDGEWMVGESSCDALPPPCVYNLGLSVCVCILGFC